MDGGARHVWVSGLVQGVAFRYHTRVLARELGLRGWVRNLPDGRVEVWAEGERAELERLVAWLRHGPPSAQVSGVEVVHAPAQGLAGFEVQRV